MSDADRRDRYLSNHQVYPVDEQGPVDWARALVAWKEKCEAQAGRAPVTYFDKGLEINVKDAPSAESIVKAIAFLSGLLA